ncbi:MAG: chromosome segregation protein SMC [Firmicutes bacterium]|nr:chromosome segregation protein SMC [Bacillota bacterium]
MRLKSLEIAGFKSFAQPVRLEFGPGITAVVGPNGSGKSNLADALRWVLGEQSPRELRSERMEDLIFHGSAARRPVGVARVTLTLDNSDGSLPLPHAEVSITRVVDRSGLSEYRLNRQPCRLRDIAELLWGSGLGRNSYAFVSQGEVDRLVASRPAERRLLVEEAAGVTRIRARRQEAERHLGRARQAWERAGDLVAELEREHAPLRLAAERAVRRAALEEERLRLATSRLGLRWRRLEEAGARLREELARLEEEARAAAGEAARAEQELAEAAREEAEAREPRLRLERRAAAEEARRLAVTEQWRRQVEESRRAAEEARRAAEARPGRGSLEAERRLSELSEERARAEAEAERREQEAREAAEEARAAERETGEAEAAASRAEAAWRRAEERLQDALRRRDAERAGRKERLEAARARSGEAERALARMRDEAALRRREEAAARGRLEASRQRLAAAGEELERRRRRRREAEAGLERLREALRARRQRLELLRGLEESEAGYPAGVRTVLQGRQRGEPAFREVVGPLGELLRVEEELARAVEVALGPQAYHLVIASGRAAQEAVEALRRAGAGRVTFLPLDALRPRRPSADEEPAEREAGAIGWASRLCRYEPRLEPAVAYALGRVLVARDLAAARRIAARYGLRFPVVTLEGDQVHAGGAISGGAWRGRAPGVVARRAEEERLEAEAARLAGEVGEGEALLAEAARAEAEAARARAEAEAEARAAELEAARAEERAGQVAARLEELERARAEAAAELARLEAETAAAGGDGGEPAGEADLRRAKADLERAEAERREAGRRLGEARQRLEAALARRQETGLARERARARAAQLAREQAWLADEVLRLEEAAREQAERARQAARRAEELAAEASRRLDELAALAWRAECAEEAAAGLAERETAARRRGAAAEARLGEARRRSELAAQRMQAVRLRLARLEAEGEALGREAAVTGARAPWEEPAGEEPAPLAEEELSARLTEVEEELRRLGPVNPEAPGQLAELEGRLGFLRRQLDDLERSRANLERLLGELEAEAERRFRRGLEEVRRAFAAIFARLFQGGEADLRLSEEEGGEAGVEIEVRPPGKRRSPLGLLSGGERALTALAFLLALEQVHPSPFLVLDEADAPLDESSAARLGAFLREQSRRLQVLVITHQRGTMEVADRLWGVTSAERGVSQLFSLELARAASE